jgi:regulatory subunit for Cdc7p protein kinase
MPATYATSSSHLCLHIETNNPCSNDILLKARDMGMKIWTMDKITRILHTLAPTDSDIVTTDTRQPYGKERPNREAELSRLLREDKRYASSDKSWMFDMMPFRGYHVYVRDMDERSKPVMIRDYPKPASKEQGKWPQLRVSPLGRCPFIEEQPSRRAIEPVRRTTVEQVKARSRSITMEATQTQDRLESREALAERANPPEMPPPVKRSSTDQLPLFGSAQASLRRVPRFVQGEPIASGVQPSNITSAVRSQMISSTAALPGGKGGSSRELNNLKRKILEKNGAGDVAFINNHIRAAINEDSGRPTKRKMLDDIVEDTAAHQQRVSRKKRVVEKELKPGYCENCRDKYADFDEHILSKEHRKFAVNNEHFRDLDTLLEKLQRI